MGTGTAKVTAPPLVLLLLTEQGRVVQSTAGRSRARQGKVGQGRAGQSKAVNEERESW